MNIWALDKDQSIKYLLILLEGEFDPSSFKVDCESPTDPCAIYLEHCEEPEMKAYIFTLGQKYEHYGVHLEFPQQHTPISLMESYEGLTFKALREILCVHLDLTVKAECETTKSTRNSEVQ